MKRALITGITGQVGSYLTELLLDKGYEVHGIIRRSSTLSTERIDHVYRDPHDVDGRLHLHYGDMTDASNLRAVVERVDPHEVYNLAAQSHVKVSFEQPAYTVDVVATGALRLLEVCRGRDGLRFYQASSSEMYGNEPPPQDEYTPFRPRSPYACAKLAAHTMVDTYRKAYGMHASCGIVFNTESPRRGETFVTRKITRAAARIKLGLQEKVYLGNLDAQRDWSFAGDVARGIWTLVQHDVPGDYVFATGESYAVRDFAARAFGLLDLDWRQHVVIDPRYLRPAEVHSLRGRADKARSHLGWAPTVRFAELVAMMVKSDLELARREALLVRHGHRVEVRAET